MLGHYPQAWSNSGVRSRFAGLATGRGWDRVRANSLWALSARRPWANLIASGRKTVELRSWTTDYRGPVALVAGQTIDRLGAARMRSSQAELMPVRGRLGVFGLPDSRSNYRCQSDCRML